MRQQNPGSLLLILEDWSDDRGGVRKFARLSFNKKRYYILEAVLGKKALLLSENDKDKNKLLHADRILFQMSGADLAPRFGAIRPESKVLFRSSYSEDAIFRICTLRSQSTYSQTVFEGML